MSNHFFNRAYDLLPRAHPRIVSVYKTWLTVITFITFVVIMPKVFELEITSKFGLFVSSSIIAVAGLGVIHGIEMLKPFLYTKKHLWTFNASFTWVVAELIAAALVSAILFNIYISVQEEISLDPFAVGILHFGIMLASLPPIIVYRNVYLRRRKLFYIGRINPLQKVEMKSYDESESISFTLKEIQFIEALETGVMVYVYQNGASKKYLLQNNIFSLEADFFKLPIVWAHKNFLVNLLSIKSLHLHPAETLTIKLKGATRHLPVGRSFVSLLKKQHEKLGVE